MAKRWKILCLLLALVMTLGVFAACKKQPDPEPDTPDAPPVEDPTPQTPVDTIDLSEYAIVRPSRSQLNSGKKLSTLLTSAVSSFKREVDALTGSDATLTDDAAEPNSETKEILIGYTNRPESAQAMEQLPGEHSFAIRKIGNKLTIVGHTEELVTFGLKYLLENYVPNSKGEGKFTLDVDFSYTQEFEYHEIVADSMPKYELIYSMTANNSVKGSTESLWRQVNRVTKQDAVMDFDHVHPLYGVEGLVSREAIVVGPTNFPRTQELKAVTDYFSWVIETDHRRQIYIFGADNASVKQACAQMSLMFDAAKVEVEDEEGTVTNLVRITKTEPIQGNGAEWTLGIPKYQGGTLDSVEEFSKGYYRMYYTGATRTAFDLYQQKVLDAGYTLYGTNELEGNAYHTYTNDKVMLHAYYLAAQNTVSVAVTPIENFVEYPTAPQVLENITTPTLGIASMDYLKITGTDGAGFVFRLADGSYVIIDGGHRRTYKTTEVEVPVLDEEGNPVLDEEGNPTTTIEKQYTVDYPGLSEKLYNYLKENNAREDGKIIVRAWILTNAKSDHYGAFYDFATDYADDPNVTVQNLVAQFDYEKQIKADSTGVATGNGEDVERINNARIALRAQHIVPLAGQKMYFGSLEMNFLYTAEVYCHADPENVGDHSLVIKANFEGSSFLFTSDIGSDSLKILTNNYSEKTLKSDFVQAPNHGNVGSRKFWNAASPKYLFISTTAKEAKIATTDATAFIDYLMTLVDENNEYLVEAIFDGQDRYSFVTAKFPFEYKTSDGGYDEGAYDTEKDTVGWGDIEDTEVVIPNENHRPGDYENDKDSTTWEDLITPDAA